MKFLERMYECVRLCFFGSIGLLFILALCIVNLFTKYDIFETYDCDECQRDSCDDCPVYLDAIKGHKEEMDKFKDEFIGDGEKKQVWKLGDESKGYMPSEEDLENLRDIKIDTGNGEIIND